MHNTTGNWCVVKTQKHVRVLFGLNGIEEDSLSQTSLILLQSLEERINQTSSKLLLIRRGASPKKSSVTSPETRSKTSSKNSVLMCANNLLVLSYDHCSHHRN